MALQFHEHKGDVRTDAFQGGEGRAEDEPDADRGGEKPDPMDQAEPGASEGAGEERKIPRKAGVPREEEREHEQLLRQALPLVYKGRIPHPGYGRGALSDLV